MKRVFLVVSVLSFLVCAACVWLAAFGVIGSEFDGVMYFHTVVGLVSGVFYAALDIS